MKRKISANGIRVKVLKNLIMLHNTLYERYEGFDWMDSHIYPDYKNYLWIIVKEDDVMDILGCSKHTTHDYLAFPKNIVG